MDPVLRFQVFAIITISTRYMGVGGKEQLNDSDFQSLKSCGRGE